MSNNIISQKISNDDKWKDIKPLIKEEVCYKNQISAVFVFEMWEPSSESASCGEKPSPTLWKEISSFITIKNSFIIKKY